MAAGVKTEAYSAGTNWTRRDNLDRGGKYHDTEVPEGRLKGLKGKLLGMSICLPSGPSVVLQSLLLPDSHLPKHNGDRACQRSPSCPVGPASPDSPRFRFIVFDKIRCRQDLLPQVLVPGSARSLHPLVWL